MKTLLFSSAIAPFVAAASCFGMIPAAASTPSKRQISYRSHGLKSLAILFLMLNALSADTFGLFTYTDNGTSITIVGYPYDAVGAVVVPATIIGKPVTNIGDNAFYACRGLTSVTIPGSVTGIGNSAFGFCSGLTSATIPASVTSIGVTAFFDCTGLTSIIVDASNPNYSSLDGVLFDKSKTSLIQCPAGLNGSIAIPSSVTSICDWSFDGCAGLTNVAIPAGVTSIGYRSFHGCTGLASVTIPIGVEIGEKAFSGCTGLTSVSIPEGVTEIGFDAFSGCTGLVSVTIPSSVTIIGSGLFSGCTGLSSITIPSSVTSIGGFAFAGCTGLTSITIPSSVTAIGYGAFDSCIGLTSMTIPASVTWIGTYAFNGCTGLASIMVDVSSPNYSSLDGVLFNKSKTSLIRCPPAGLNGSYSIPSSVTEIGESAFFGCTGLTSLAIPSSVTNIENYSNAFSSCTGLTSITVDAANPNYSSLNGVLFNKSKTSLIKCPAGFIGSYSIPSNVTLIESYAFVNCLGLTGVTIPASVTIIGSYAFSGCSGLTIIMVDAANTNYSSQGGVLFNKSKTLLIQCPPAGLNGSYAIPGSVTYIGSNSFYGCSGLTAVNIPGSVTRIGQGAFSGCTGLVNVTIPSSVIYLDDGIFFDCTGLTSVALPSSLQSIGSSVFRGCTGLTVVTIPGSVTSISDMAFSGCSNLMRVLFLGSAPQVSWSAFEFVASGFAVYYHDGALGFTTPVWKEYPSFPLEADNDGDGWTNYEEIVIHGTTPSLWDTDGDGVKDSMDALPLNSMETLDSDHDGTGDNTDTDDDGDGYTDEDEINIHGTNPKRADSDGDGLSDPQEIQTHLTNPNLADTDSDGLSDGAEVNTHGTLPKVGDTDSDGFLDGYEVLTGKSPLNNLDKPALVAEARTAIEFTFPSAIGKSYRIEDSLDLKSWTTVESGIAGNGAVIQRFYTTRNVPKRYFRVEEDSP